MCAEHGEEAPESPQLKEAPAPQQGNLLDDLLNLDISSGPSAAVGGAPSFGAPVSHPPPSGGADFLGGLGGPSEEPLGVPSPVAPAASAALPKVPSARHVIIDEANGGGMEMIGEVVRRNGQTFLDVTITNKVKILSLLFLFFF